MGQACASHYHFNLYFLEQQSQDPRYVSSHQQQKIGLEIVSTYRCLHFEMLNLRHKEECREEILHEFDIDYQFL